MCSCFVTAIMKSNMIEITRRPKHSSSGDGGEVADIIPPTKKRITIAKVMNVEHRPLSAPIASGNLVLALLNTTVLKKNTGTFRTSIKA